MKKLYLTLTIIASFILFTGCINENMALNRYEEKEQWEKQILIDQQEKLQIENEVGQINVEQWDEDHLKIVTVKKVQGPDIGKVQTLLESYDYNVTESDGTITIESKEMDIPQSYNLSIDYTISIPRQLTSLDIVDDVGQVIITGDYKTIQCKTDVGAISADLDHPTQVLLHSEVGSVNAKLKSLELEGNYILETDVGEVTLEIPKDTRINIKGERYTLKNVIQSDDGIVVELKTEVGKKSILGY